MPGIQSLQTPGAVFVPDWSVYRGPLAVDDNLADPSLVTEVIDLSDLPAGNGCQIWITAERKLGAGLCQLFLYYNGFGSLAAIKPFNAHTTAFMAVDDLQEIRFTGLPAVPCRVLIGGIVPGDQWNLHYTKTSLPVI